MRLGRLISVHYCENSQVIDEFGNFAYKLFMAESTVRLSITIESTPNPEAMMFKVNRDIAKLSQSFSSASDALNSPLAKKLFGFPWAKTVMIGSNFVTVVKQDWVDWKVLAEPLADLIAEHIERGEGIITEPVVQHTDQDPISVKIRQIFEAEIRPAVAQDGGDIVFRKFENGQVFVTMQGACSGCPSSTLTLKDGIESRLKEMIPEVREVIDIS